MGQKPQMIQELRAGLQISTVSGPQVPLSGGPEFVTEPLLADRFPNLKCEMASLLNLHFRCGALQFFHHLFLTQLQVSYNFF